MTTAPRRPLRPYYRTSTSTESIAYSAMSATGAINNGAVGQAKVAQSEQAEGHSLPLDIWLSSVLPLTPLQDLLPLCSTSKWLGDELKHDVVIKAALAKRGYGEHIICVQPKNRRICRIYDQSIAILLYFCIDKYINSPPFSPDPQLPSPLQM